METWLLEPLKVVLQTLEGRQFRKDDAVVADKDQSVI